MTHSFSVKSILAASLVLIMSLISSTSSALVKSTSLSGCFKLSGCTIYADSVMTGLGNTSSNPTAFTVSLALISGTAYCKNHGKQAGPAEGMPFEGWTWVEASESVDYDRVKRNGKYLSSLAFHDEDLAAALGIECQNANWIPVVVVTDVDALGQQLEDLEPANDADNCILREGEPLVTEGCAVVDNLGNTCQLPEPYYSDPSQALGETHVPYDCTEVCHDSDPTLCNYSSF
jgi:hypothetical protein